MPIGNRTHNDYNGRNTRGGLTVHVAMTAATILALVIVVFLVVRSYQHRQVEHRRKALQVCEDGLMMALQRLGEDPSWREGIERSGHGAGFYEVQIREISDASAPRLEITAHGQSGSALRKQTSILELQILQGDSVWVQCGIREH